MIIQNESGIHYRVHTTNAKWRMFMLFRTVSDIGQAGIHVTGGFDSLIAEHSINEKSPPQAFRKVKDVDLVNDSRYRVTPTDQAKALAVLKVKHAFVFRTMEDFAPTLSGYVTFPIEVGHHEYGIKESFHFYAIVPAEAYNRIVLGISPQVRERKKTIEGGEDLKPKSENGRKRSTLFSGKSQSRSMILTAFDMPANDDSDPSNRRKTLAELAGPIEEQPLIVSFSGIAPEKILYALWQNATIQQNPNEIFAAGTVSSGLKHAKNRLDNGQTYFDTLDLTVAKDSEPGDCKRKLDIVFEDDHVIVNNYDNLYGEGKAQQVISELLAPEHKARKSACCVIS